MDKTKRELVIKNLKTGEIVRRFDVTGKSERQIEKIERGALINMDTDRFCIGEETPPS